MGELLLAVFVIVFFYIGFKEGKNLPTEENPGPTPIINDPPPKNNLINCPECNLTVSRKAETCPHCGFKLPTNKMGCMSIVLIGIALLFIFSLLGKPSNTPSKSIEKSETEKKKDAYYMCTAVIKRTLKNPASADFEGFDYASFTGMGLDNWDITMTVRATNSFNAIVPSTYVCTVKAHDGNASVSNIKNLD